MSYGWRMLKLQQVPGDAGHWREWQILVIDVRLKTKTSYITVAQTLLNSTFKFEFDA